MGVALDPGGRIYVATTEADRQPQRHRLRCRADGECDSDSHDQRGRASLLDQPIGIALDAAGRIYVANSGNHESQSADHVNAENATRRRAVATA